MTCSHGNESEWKVNDHHCKSTLDIDGTDFGNRNGAVEMKLMLEVTAMIRVQSLAIQDIANCDTGQFEPVIYTAEGEPPPQELELFKAEFAGSVRQAWSNKLLLVAPSNPTMQVRCLVEVRFTENAEEDIHLRMDLLVRPRAPAVRYHDHPDPARRDRASRQAVTAGSASQLPLYRSACLRGGARNPDTGRPDSAATDMFIVWDGPGTLDFTHEDVATSDQGEVDIPQNVAGHEFGHYLGLGHTCESAPGDGQWCDYSAYCSRGPRRIQENIMAMGTRVDVEHHIPWKERIALHHWGCGIPWVPRLVRRGG